MTLPAVLMDRAEIAQALTLTAAAETVGSEKHAVNQDAVCQRIGQALTGEGVGLFVVCDGLGGHERGELASQVAIQTLTSGLRDLLPRASASYAGQPRPTAGALESRLRAVVAAANRAVYKQGPPVAGTARPGSTVALALVYGDSAIVASAGDSRVYLCRDGELQQITTDHSLAEKLLEAGIVDSPEAAEGQRHVIYRALGIEATVEPDIFHVRLEHGDTLLLCSDGLWKAFSDPEELAKLLEGPIDPAVLCHYLVTEAVHRDGSDDTSAVVVAVGQS
jgi:protein phosphatase